MVDKYITMANSSTIGFSDSKEKLVGAENKRGRFKQGFDSTVQVEWPEGAKRDMQLLRDLVYTDKNGRRWIALRGSLIDGASIPSFFWPVIGSPFVGYYRRATVIHDVYCKSQMRAAQEVHDVFLEMMLWDKVPKYKAENMFNAVDMYGPRW